MKGFTKVCGGVMVLAFLGATACTGRPPLTPEERVAKAEAKIKDIETHGIGEATYEFIWEAERELAEAQKDLEEERRQNVAIEQQRWEQQQRQQWQY